MCVVKIRDGNKGQKEVLAFDWKTGDWRDSQGVSWKVENGKPVAGDGENKVEQSQTLEDVEKTIKSLQGVFTNVQTGINGSKPLPAIVGNTKENIKNYLLGSVSALRTVLKSQLENQQKVGIVHMFFDGKTAWLARVSLKDINSEVEFIPLLVQTTGVTLQADVAVKWKDLEAAKEKCWPLGDIETVIASTKQTIRDKNFENLKVAFRKADKQTDETFNLLTNYLTESDKSKAVGIAYFSDEKSSNFLAKTKRWVIQKWNTWRGNVELPTATLRTIGEDSKEKRYEISIDWNGFIVQGANGPAMAFKDVDSLLTGLKITNPITTNVLTGDSEIQKLLDTAKSNKSKIENAQKMLESTSAFLEKQSVESVEKAFRKKRTLLGDEKEGFPDGFCIWKSVDKSFHVSFTHQGDTQTVDVDVSTQPGCIKFKFDKNPVELLLDGLTADSMQQKIVERLKTIEGYSESLPMKVIAQRATRMELGRTAVLTKAGKSPKDWEVPEGSFKESSEYTLFIKNAEQIQAQGAYIIEFGKAGNATVHYVKEFNKDGKAIVEKRNICIKADKESTEKGYIANFVLLPKEKTGSIQEFSQLDKLFESMDALFAIPGKVRENSVNINKHVDDVENGYARSLLGEDNYWFKYSQERVFDDVAKLDVLADAKDVWVARAPTTYENVGAAQKMFPKRWYWQVAGKFKDFFGWMKAKLVKKFTSQNLKLSECVLTRYVKDRNAWKVVEEKVEFDFANEKNPYKIKGNHYETLQAAATALWKDSKSLTDVDKVEKSQVTARNGHVEALRRNEEFFLGKKNYFERFGGIRSRSVGDVDARLKNAHNNAEKNQCLGCIYQEWERVGVPTETMGTTQVWKTFFTLKQINIQGQTSSTRIDVTHEGYRVKDSCYKTVDELLKGLGLKDESVRSLVKIEEEIAKNPTPANAQTRVFAR
jgi:hypothetical protein